MATASSSEASVETIKIKLPEIKLEKKEVIFKIKRYDPEKDGFYWKEYKLTITNRTTILDALLRIKETQDPTLAVRYSCRMGICGSCGMVINGTPRLACETKPYDLGTSTITVEPLSNVPPVKDIVTDFDKFFSNHKSVSPWLIRKDEKEQFEDLKEYYPQTEEELDNYLQFSYCIKCGLCYSACPLVFLNKEYLGPQALAQAYRWSADSRDQGAELRLKLVDTDNGVWSCNYSGTCSKVCPKDVDPALAINMVKKMLLTGRKR